MTTSHPAPLSFLLILCVLAAIGAQLCGLSVAALVLLLAAGLCFLRLKQPPHSRSRLCIHYLPAPLPEEPLIRLERGQTATLPWPHPLQVLLPQGARLQILERTPEASASWRCETRPS